MIRATITLEEVPRVFSKNNPNTQRELMEGVYFPHAVKYESISNKQKNLKMDIVYSK